MKRRNKADAERNSRPARKPAPKPEPASPIVGQPEPKAVQASDETPKPFACLHCGQVDIAGKHALLNIYPNGRERYRCSRCGLPFIVDGAS